jgi:hypothetical protein
MFNHFKLHKDGDSGNMIEQRTKNTIVVIPDSPPSTTSFYTSIIEQNAQIIRLLQEILEKL